MPAGLPLARLPLARLLLAGLLLNVLLVAGIIPGTRPSAFAATTSPAVRVDVDEVSPSALVPGSLLTVKGRITNTGSAPLTRLLVNLRSRWNPLATRAEVQQWSSGDSALTTTSISRIDSPVPLAGPLAPGATAEFTLQTSPAILGLTPGSSFGTRGLVVRVLAQAEEPPLQRAGEAHTFLVWSPGRDGVQPTRLTVLAPVTSTLPQSDASTPQDALLASMTRTGRLGRLLATVREGSLSWAVDPALLVAAQHAQAPAGDNAGADQGQGASASWPSSPTSTGSTPGTTPSATASGASPPATAGSPSGSLSATPGQGEHSPSPELAITARSWLDQAVTLSGSQRPFALPLGDPDLAAIAHAGQDAADLLGLARSLADTATRQVLGDPLRSDVALPAEGRADPATARLLSSVGWQSAVLAGSSLPPATPQVATAPPRATITQGGTLAAALYDEQLSSLIAQLGTPQSAPALQRLTAELATITAERPDDSRSVLAVAPRDWDPDPTTAGPALQVLRRLPWVQLQSMDALLAERPSDLRRSGLQYPRKARAAELPTEHVQAVVDAHRSLEAFRPALTQPELVVPQLQRYEVCVLGLAWRARITELAAARQPLASGISRLYDGVVVATPSVQQLISHSGRFQVYVQNRLDQPVQVQLQLQPRSGRLLVRDPEPFTVPANGHHSVFIAVRAVANGDAVLDATVWTSPPGAEPISPSLPILVQVHSNWENIGLSGAGVLLGLLVVAGLVRGVRRGRNPLPPESAPDADEEVVRRESGRRWPFGRGGDGASAPGSGGASAAAPGIAGAHTSPAPALPHVPPAAMEGSSPTDAPGPGPQVRSAGSDDRSEQHPVRRHP